MCFGFFRARVDPCLALVTKLALLVVGTFVFRERVWDLPAGAKNHQVPRSCRAPSECSRRLPAAAAPLLTPTHPACRILVGCLRHVALRVGLQLSSEDVAGWR